MLVSPHDWRPQGVDELEPRAWDALRETAQTRAEQRAFFAYCSERGNVIGWLEQLLLPAGVEQIDGANIVAPNA